mmetsp:Transcript_25853/g.41827  ORF Transcript_25853/g.41827 Transcript_25853/m.41827 type:complete len:90 (-) Transcript_25853:1607-1876(-)
MLAGGSTCCCMPRVLVPLRTCIGVCECVRGVGLTFFFEFNPSGRVDWGRGNRPSKRSEKQRIVFVVLPNYIALTRSKRPISRQGFQGWI